MGSVDVILEDVEPEDGSPLGPRYLTVWPNQVGMIICDGRVEEVFSGGKRELPKGEVWTYIAYTAPLRLVFWLKDPDDPLEPEEGVILDQPALTSDGQPVTGRIEIVFSVIQDNVELLLQLLPRDRSEVTSLDLAKEIKGELLAKALTFDIYSYTASQLRGNQTLFREIYDSLKRELASTIGRYGLQLDNFYVSWGLTPEERERFKEERHRIKVRDIEREQELEDAARRVGEQREREQQAREQQVREQQAREQREQREQQEQREQREREQQAREQQVREQQAREQQEQREQREREQQAREQQVREQREQREQQEQREQREREQQAREQQVREQQAREQQEQREQREREQQAREQQVREQQAREQQEQREQREREQQAREQREQQEWEQVPPSDPYDLDLGPGFEGLSSQGKGKQARAAYLLSVGIHSASTPGRQWVQCWDGTWLCIAYSSEVAPGQWFFTSQKAKIEEKLADGSMAGAVFLCAIGSGRLIAKELSVERLENVLHKLSYTPKDDFVWFMIYRRGDGRYHLENGRTSLDEVL